MVRARRFRTWWLVLCLATAWTHNIWAKKAGARQAMVTASSSREPERATYTVRPNDVLSLIAQREDVSLDLLRKVNGLATDAIRPGQVLLLPSLYTVAPGDVLGVIAERRGVSVRELCRHNNLNERSLLKVGQRLIVAGGTRAPGTSDATTPPASSPKQQKPRRTTVKPSPTAEAEHYLHKVRPGEALSLIAARYTVPTKTLQELNQLGRSALIRVGQRLKIPITNANTHLTRPNAWSQYAQRNFERGRVTLKTLGGQWSGQVLDAQGGVLPDARKHIESLLASWETGSKVQITLDPRLYKLIVTVSDEFGGRPIRVVSGYRERSFARHSKHRLGRALDFSIPGVPNTALVDFLLTLPSTGVGYYPNATHVHMDARGSRMYWVDVSGPGQAPRYVHKSNRGQRAPKAVVAKAAGSASKKGSYHSAMVRLDSTRF